MSDGERNRTSYGYDGFDRRTTTAYPVATPGQDASDASDYESVGYDANGNVTSRRLRDGQTTGYAYDALDRMVLQDLSGNGIDLDIGYGYDLLGRLTTSGNAVGHLTNHGYDALGRATSETTTYGGTKTSAYDLAGRRTRLTWSDGFYVTYEYDATGAMTAIRENGGLALATFGYDDLGRRTSLVRGNGTSTSYAYDPVSRLSQLTQDLGGTAYDATKAFAYNPAGQIGAGRAATTPTPIPVPTTSTAATWRTG